MKLGLNMISASTNSPANCAEQRPPAAQLPEEITVPAPPEKTGTVNASTPLGKLIAALGLKHSVVIPFTLKWQRFRGICLAERFAGVHIRIDVGDSRPGGEAFVDDVLHGRKALLAAAGGAVNVA